MRSEGENKSHLGLNDGEGSEGATAHGLGHLGSTLQQAGVQVEHITCSNRTSGDFDDEIMMNQVVI